MNELILSLDGKKLPFSAVVSISEDNEDIFLEAVFEDPDSWKTVFFDGVPHKEIYKHHETIQRIYDELEEQLVQYTKEYYTDIDIDWDTLVYDELLINENSFRMSAMINKKENAL